MAGDAVDQGCDTVVWGAGVQSNNCRQTAAGCAKLGLECRLYLSQGHYRTEPQGNLLLDYLVGYIDRTLKDDRPEEAANALQFAATQIWQPRTSWRPRLRIRTTS